MASFQATEVQIPGADGDMTAMPDHAPTLTTLRPGVLVVKADGSEQEYVVTGGFAEISPAGVSVLAERALPKGEVTAADVAAMIETAETAAAGKADGALDDANKAVSDVRALALLLGF
ncbi:MAG: F0F1 ATP synthase subunit epsilon [Pseudomonadota bacterium]